MSGRLWVRQNARTMTLLIACVAIFVLIITTLDRPHEPALDTPTITTDTDDAGRVCTTATTATSVAIDCDFPPAENRVGEAARNWLDRLEEQP